MNAPTYFALFMITHSGFPFRPILGSRRMSNPNDQLLICQGQNMLS